MSWIITLHFLLPFFMAVGIDPPPLWLWGQYKIRSEMSKNCDRNWDPIKEWVNYKGTHRVHIPLPTVHFSLICSLAFIMISCRHCGRNESSFDWLILNFYWRTTWNAGHRSSSSIILNTKKQHKLNNMYIVQQKTTLANTMFMLGPWFIVWEVANPFSWVLYFSWLSGNTWQ